MLRPYVAVVGSFCFFLRERQNFLGSLSKSLDRVHRAHDVSSTLMGTPATWWGQHLLVLTTRCPRQRASNIPSPSPCRFPITRRPRSRFPIFWAPGCPSLSLSACRPFFCPT